MGYRDLIEALTREGEAQGIEILEKARSEAESIITKAKYEADKLERSLIEESRLEIDIEIMKLINRAGLEAKRIFLQARYDVLKEVLHKLEERLSAMCKGNEYDQILEKLLKETLGEGLGNREEGDLIIYTDEDACDRLRKICQRLGLKVKVEAKEGISGGIEVEIISNDRKILMKNTFHHRLDKIRPEITLELNKLLFGAATMEVQPQ